MPILLFSFFLAFASRKSSAVKQHFSSDSIWTQETTVFRFRRRFACAKVHVLVAREKKSADAVPIIQNFVNFVRKKEEEISRDTAGLEGFLDKRGSRWACWTIIRQQIVQRFRNFEELQNPLREFRDSGRLSGNFLRRQRILWRNFAISWALFR